MAPDAGAWARSFHAALASDHAATATLREASLAGDLGAWTQTLTGMVSRSLHHLGLRVAAKGHPHGALPVVRGEYLALDVAAFAGPDDSWRFPAFVCELENSPRNELVEYALWKVLCIRNAVRVLFCYRSGRTDGANLVRALANRVVGPMALHDREHLSGDTLVFVGSRSDAASFPYGFFRAWRLNRNLGQFESFVWQE